MNIELIMLLILFLVIILTPQIKSIEKFNVFDHTLYYPDVDCLYTKQNSCIIKPNNDSFYNYNNNCCNKPLESDKYYEKVNSTCIDCINNKCNCHKNIETFDGRAHYDRKTKTFYKTDSPGLYIKNKKCSDYFFINKDKICQQYTY
tara:strand:+ start:6897 stop:7334 length:438 start_codon:yes stop_codon:yes gene_type:complete